MEEELVMGACRLENGGEERGCQMGEEAMVGVGDGAIEGKECVTSITKAGLLAGTSRPAFDMTIL